MSEQITYMNRPDRCICCGKKPYKTEGNIKINKVFKKIKIPLIKHHVQYEPEIIAYVHFDCHQIIHDPEDPRYKVFIQFEAGQSREHYDKKRD